MPRIGNFQSPTKVIDGVTTVVDLPQWANITLDSANLTIFNAAYSREQEIWRNASISGNLVAKMVDPNGIAWPNENVWPQVMHSSSDGLTREVSAPYVANIAPANLGIESDFTITNYTGGFTRSAHVFANNAVVLLGPVVPLDPTGWTRQFIFNNEDIVQDPEYVMFQEQYLADTTLTWPGFNGYINGNI